MRIRSEADGDDGNGDDCDGGDGHGDDGHDDDSNGDDGNGDDGHGVSDGDHSISCTLTSRLATSTFASKLPQI